MGLFLIWNDDTVEMRFAWFELQLELYTLSLSFIKTSFMLTGFWLDTRVVNVLEMTVLNIDPEYFRKQT